MEALCASLSTVIKMWHCDSYFSVFPWAYSVLEAVLRKEKSRYITNTSGSLIVKS